VSRIETRATARGFVFQIAGSRTNGWFTLGSAGALVPAVAVKSAPVLAAMTAAGVEPISESASGGPCAVVARDRAGPDGRRVISLTAHGRGGRTIGDRFGAGLAGLPLP
jgi:hypothetical protein